MFSHVHPTHSPTYLAYRYKLHPLQLEDVLTCDKERMKSTKTGSVHQVIVGRANLVGGLGGLDGLGGWVGGRHFPTYIQKRRRANEQRDVENSLPYSSVHLSPRC